MIDRLLINSGAPSTDGLRSSASVVYPRLSPVCLGSPKLICMTLLRLSTSLPGALNIPPTAINWDKLSV